MKNTLISLLLITANISLVYLKENGPYLLIEDVNNPQVPVPSTIELAAGQNLTLKCFTNTRKDHGVFWTWRNSQLKTSDGMLKLLRVSKADEGLYGCVSPKMKLTKEVDVIVKDVRFKRYDDDPFQLPPGPIQVGDVLKMRDEFLRQFPADSWGPKTNPHEVKDWLDDYHEHQEETRRYNHNIGIGVGGVVAVICFLVVICVVCKRMNDRNPHPTTYAMPSSAQPGTNTVESCPLNAPMPSTNFRPIETRIPTYPPTTSIVPPLSVAKAPKSDCSAPPSYDEAVNNIGPSAPSRGQ